MQFQANGMEGGGGGGKSTKYGMFFDWQSDSQRIDNQVSEVKGLKCQGC